MVIRWVILGAAVLFAAYCLLVLVSSWLVDTSREYGKNSRYYRWLLYSATALALFFGRIRLHVSGMEKLPAQGRFLLVSNHRSKFDPITSWYVLRRYDVAFISKQENFSVPMFGRIIRRCCFLSIDRENPRRALTTVEHAAALIRADEVSIGVYPEGTRSQGGQLLPFHCGVFKIAQEAGVPIVVMAVQGTEKIHRNFPWRRTDVFIDILDTIPAEYTAAQRTCDLGDEIRGELEKHLGQGGHEREAVHSL